MSPKKCLTIMVILFLTTGLASVGISQQVQPAQAGASLTDINPSWAKPQISALVGQGIITGYPDATFRPDSFITRAEFITIVNRTFQVQGSAPVPFPDAQPGAWYFGEVARAVAGGYLPAYPQGKLFPGQQVDREEAAYMLAQAMHLGPPDPLNLNFSDAATISPWSRDSIAAMVASGLIRGYPDGSYRPLQNITRAEASAIIYKALKPYQWNIPAVNGGDFRKISVISDLHLDESAEGVANRTRFDAYMQEIDSYNPDMVIVCGDLYTGTAYLPPASAPYGHGFANVYREVDAALDYYAGRDIPVIFVAGNHDYEQGSYYASDSGMKNCYGLLGTRNFDLFILGAHSQGWWYNDDELVALDSCLATRADKHKPLIVASHYPIDQGFYDAYNAARIKELLDRYDQPVIFLWGHSHDLVPAAYYQEYPAYTTANAGAIGYRNVGAFAQGLNLTFDRSGQALDFAWMRAYADGKSIIPVERLTQHFNR